MRTLLSFEEFVNENFGAITMNFPPGHDKPLIQTPDIAKPLSISGNYGGNSRIPKQWINSPSLSGGFYGSGYGHFGESPNDKDTSSDASSSDYRRHLKDEYKSTEDVKKTLMGLAGEMRDRNNKKRELMNLQDIEEAFVKESNDEELLNRLEEEMDGLELDYDVEIITRPTDGNSGTYDDPPEGGVGGEYEASLINDLYNTQSLETLGFPKNVSSPASPINRITNLKLFHLFLMTGNAFNNKILKEASSKLAGALEEKFHSIDEDIWDDSNVDFYTGELFEEADFGRGIDYLAFKYIILAGLRIQKEYWKLNDEIRSIKNIKAGLPRKEMKKIYQKLVSISEAARKHLGFPENARVNFYHM